jgi:hypothetical protein|tara:strand:- start:6234 stop:6464 length:231 start_codon:yes stop_codon:yes gene_type:complete
MAYAETQKDRDFNKITSLMEDYMDSQKIIKSMRKDLKEVRSAVKGILEWSQRIGSDEIYELNEIVRFINQSAIKNK